MLLLAADTSGKHGSIALARADSSACVSLEVIPLAGGTFSAQLVPQIAELLAKHHVSKQDIDGFAVVSGPGSFTGLRVGLAAIKALAEVLQKPIAAASLLEAIAFRSIGKVAAVLDAGRGQVYAGFYEAQEGELPVCVREELLEVDSFLDSARGSTVMTADGNVAAILRESGIAVQDLDRPQADVIAQIGWRKILRSHTVSPEDLDANYIRRSDAEIFSKVSS